MSYMDERVWRLLHDYKSAFSPLNSIILPSIQLFILKVYALISSRTLFVITDLLPKRIVVLILFLFFLFF